MATALVAVPTGLNAAWLTVATAIGVSLVAQLVPAARSLATPSGGAAMLAAAVAGCAVLVPVLGRSPATLGLGLAYAAGTTWACFGVTRGDSPKLVKSVAAIGIKVAASSGAATALYALLW